MKTKKINIVSYAKNAVCIVEIRTFAGVRSSTAAAVHIMALWRLCHCSVTAGHPLSKGGQLHHMNVVLSNKKGRHFFNLVDVGMRTETILHFVLKVSSQLYSSFCRGRSRHKFRS